LSAVGTGGGRYKVVRVLVTAASRWRIHHQGKKEIEALTTDLDEREARFCEAAVFADWSFSMVGEYLQIRSLRKVLKQRPSECRTPR
jgi:hypothetical protein